MNRTIFLTEYSGPEKGLPRPPEPDSGSVRPQDRYHRTDEDWGCARRSIGPVEAWLACLLDHSWILLGAMEHEDRGTIGIGLADKEESNL